jgi:hypothetical protein
MGTTIKCTFEDKDDLINISNGQTVTIKGKLDQQSLGIISIDECQLVE